MEKKQQYQMNLSAPNLLNICIDHTSYGEISGRMFHCYSIEPIVFANVVELMKKAEEFFDAISFPQASTKSRTFLAKDELKPQQSLNKVLDQADVVQKKGLLGTFITIVKFRQNSTWQGELLWVENNEKGCFTNSLDFVKLVDNALSQCSTIE